MHFAFVDRVIEQSDTSITTLKAVTLAEEYLQDHFKGFEVLPGVFMLESLVQAARHLLTSIDPAHARWVLAEAKAVRYGSFVRPGETLRCHIELQSRDDSNASFKARAVVLEQDSSERVCVTGRFSLRPAKPLDAPARVHSSA